MHKNKKICFIISEEPRQDINMFDSVFLPFTYYTQKAENTIQKWKLKKKLTLLLPTENLCRQLYSCPVHREVNVTWSNLLYPPGIQEFFGILIHLNK